MLAALLPPGLQELVDSHLGILSKYFHIKIVNNSLADTLASEFSDDGRRLEEQDATAEEGEEEEGEESQAPAPPAPPGTCEDSNATKSILRIVSKLASFGAPLKHLLDQGMPLLDLCSFEISPSATPAVKMVLHRDRTWL